MRAGGGRRSPPPAARSPACELRPPVIPEFAPANIRDPAGRKFPIRNNSPASAGMLPIGNVLRLPPPNTPSRPHPAPRSPAPPGPHGPPSGTLLDDQVAEAIDHAELVRKQERGGVELGEDGGAVDAGAGAEALAGIDGG